MEKKFFIAKKVLLLLVVLFCVFLCFKLFVFYLPFCIAYIFATILNPVIDKIGLKFNWSRKLSVVFVLILFFIIFAVLLFVAGNKIIEESSFFSSMITTYIEKAYEAFNSINLPQNEVTRNLILRNANDLLNNFETNSKKLITGLINGLKNVPVWFINFIITILSLYFILTDRFSILDKLEFQFSKKIISKIRFKIEKILNVLIGYVKAELVLIGINFIIVLTGLYIFKLIGMNVKYPFLMAILIGIVDALPVLGAGTAMIPWSIILFLNKETALGFSILGLFLCMLFTKQILEPKIVSNKIGVHPFFTIIAMYTGFKMLGFIGILLGPVILIVLKEIFDNFLDQGLINYFKY